MIRSVLINNVKHKIEPQYVLGSGGEATVVKIDNNAVKIYHNPDAKRIRKITHFVNTKPNLPLSVCAPQSLAHNVSGEVVGFSMRLLTENNEVVNKLSSRTHRNANPQLTTKLITNLMIDGYNTIESCHKNGVIIGDNNDLNVLYNDKYLTFIDADSFQIGNYPCLVGTENFLPPELYNVDLSLRPAYKPEHDWYSWMCMFVRSVLLVHPFGGTHPTILTLTQRALQGITAFDKNVRYPKIGYSREILSDAILDIFDQIFRMGRRFIPDRFVFDEYTESLQSCNHCNTQFPHNRKSCPQCATINTQQINRQIKISKTSGTKKISVEELISTNGKFIWHKQYFNSISAISIENNKYVYYSVNPGQNTKKMELFEFQENAKFDLVSGKYLIIHKSISSKQLSIFDVSGDKPKLFDDRSNDRVFTCTDKNLVRVYNGFLMRGNFRDDLKILQETNINAVIENQTIIFGASDTNTIIGLQRIFNVFSYFIYSFDNNEYFTTQISLDKNESVIDLDAYFHGSSILFLMKTEITGRTYTRIYIINSGKEVFYNKTPSISSDTWSHIHGKTFVNTGTKYIVFHPTDSGIVQEVINPPNQTNQIVLSETEPFVSSSDSIFLYRKGIVVVSDKTINYLTLE